MHQLLYFPVGVAATRFVSVLCVASIAMSCGGGSNPAPPAVVAQFVGSGTPPTANMVRLALGAASGDAVTLNVMVGGPTTSADVYSFAFDLLLSDASVASYVNGSARLGSALGGSQSQSLLVSQSGNRVVVGVSRLGGGPGTRIGAPEQLLLSLTFRVRERDVTSVTFAGSSADPNNPTNAPAALDAGGEPIDSLEFDGNPARLSGA